MATLVGFDTETTGVHPASSRLVTASIVAIGDTEQTWSWLADPGVDIPRAASDVHGITTQRAREEGRPIKDVLVEIRDVLASFLSRDIPIIAFNASFDLTLLESELARHGQTTLTDVLGHTPEPIIDPLVLDRFVDKYRKGPRRLESLCTHYGVEASGFHDAHADVTATLAVWQAMVDAHPFLRVTSLRKLHEIQIDAHAQWAQSLNRYLARNGKTPDADGRWPLGLD